MITHQPTARRSAVPAWLVAATAAIMVVLLLAACSSSDGAEMSASDAAYAEGGDAGGFEADRDAAYDTGEESGGDPVPDAGRSIIVTGEMYITVDDPIAAADEVADVVQGAGGRIDARDEEAPSENFGGSASMTLRIPSGDLDAVVDDLRGLGDVDRFSTSNADVTNEVTDLEAQVSTLRASTQRIESLLVEAEDIADIIKLEDELASRQAELESLEARQRGLDDAVSMSTIHLSLTTEPAVIVDDDPRSFWDGLVAGWAGLVGFLSGLLVVVGVLLPWLVLLAVVAAVVLAIVRAMRARKLRRAEMPASGPTDAAPHANDRSST
ncbi:DUF4349 domain-containing protein [Demequina sp. NBRC 110053]|uniref:DUF4349 domain-containing protein n=1 Tax=Demequina sp. NBRC 110053 TaxID=1570342 RepID=UPI0013566F84|nr:DUF4349 domain-containing protein [Demequina sp. NBRC 110053]